MTTKFISTSLLGFGSLGGLVAGAYYLFNSETQLPKANESQHKYRISSLLTSAGRTLLENNDEFLDIKFNVYKNSLNPLNKIQLSAENKEAVKSWCDEKMNEQIEIKKKDEENSLFQIALKLCTKPTNREKLEKNSKTIAGENDWTEKQNNYRSKADGDAVIPTIKNKEQATSNEIQDWCNSALNKEIEDSEYTIVDKWCTKTLPS